MSAVAAALGAAAVAGVFVVGGVFAWRVVWGFFGGGGVAVVAVFGLAVATAAGVAVEAAVEERG